MSEIKKTFAELEAVGLLMRTGEFRRNRKGELEPVYAAVRNLSEDEVEQRLRLFYETRGNG
jgi:hypothetical protein